MGNSAISKLFGEKTIQFRSHDGCITTLQSVRHVPKLRYNPISLGALHREGFCFSLKGDRMEVFKKAQVMFQAECIGNMYMLWNSAVTVCGLQLSSASKAVVVEQSETTIDLSSNIQLYPEGRLGLGVQQGSPDRYAMVEQILIDLV